MTIIIDMNPAFTFTHKLNAIILCVVYAFLMYSSTIAWNILIILAYLLIFVTLLILISWPKRIDFRYLKLSEGEANSCFAFNHSQQANIGLSLCAHKCRISPLGCWLTFTKETNTLANDRLSLNNIGGFFNKRVTVFLPKYYLSTSDYKCLCRHLIWHSVS